MKTLLSYIMKISKIDLATIRNNLSKTTSQSELTIKSTLGNKSKNGFGNSQICYINTSLASQSYANLPQE